MRRMEIAIGHNGGMDIDLDGGCVSLRPDGDDGAVLASIDLGEPPEGAEPLARELLEANHLFSGTAGASLSVDPETHHVFLQRREWPQACGEDVFLRHLAALEGCAAEWKARLSGDAAPSPAAEDSVPLIGSIMETERFIPV